MKYKLLVLIVLFPLLLQGQQVTYYKISGTVKDICGKNLRSKANIALFLSLHDHRRILADSLGSFTINGLDTSSVCYLRFQAAGYFSERRHYKMEKDTIIHIRLHPIPPDPTLLPYIQFQYNSAAINASYADSLSGFIQTLNENPTLIIGIVGFTDSSETPSIVEARMENTLQLLLRLGIDSNRLRKFKSKTPARTFGIDSVYYDCETLRFIRGKLVTESYIKQFDDTKRQVQLRTFNRCVQFRILAD